MAQKTMKQMFDSLVEEAKKEGALRDLLVDEGREAERPRVKFDGETYYLGLLDGKPMMVKEKDKTFVNPEMMSAGVHELSWVLKSS